MFSRNFQSLCVSLSPLFIKNHGNDIMGIFSELLGVIFNQHSSEVHSIF